MKGIYSICLTYGREEMPGFEDRLAVMLRRMRCVVDSTRESYRKTNLSFWYVCNAKSTGGRSRVMLGRDALRAVLLLRNSVEGRCDVGDW